VIQKWIMTGLSINKFFCSFHTIYVIIITMLLALNMFLPLNIYILALISLIPEVVVVVIA